MSVLRVLANGGWMGAWVAVIASVGACGEDESVNVSSNRGSACVAQSAGSEVVQVAAFSDCLSSSDVDVTHTCSATREGNLITIHSQTSWKDPEGGGTPDCRIVTALCETSAPPGDYVIRFAPRELPVTLPTSTALPTRSYDPITNPTPNCLSSD